ncbi:MAG: site-specific DNA-methyltransferase [Acidobacteria bacterium]|nr:site-specific DNA-methyltransferase [Acidobacteriota bacterium]
MSNRRNQATPLVAGTGTIVHGDCTELLAQKSFPLVDLVHTSPPYNIDKPYQDYTDKLHLSDYLKFVSRVARLLSEKMRSGASLFWQTGYTQASPNSDEINPIDVLTFPLFKEHGLYLKDRIIWRYYGGMSFKSKFKNQHETILWYVKGDPENPTVQPYFNIDAVRETSREHDPRNNLLGRNPGNVWQVDRVAYGSIEQTSHIAVFPEEVTERIIRACSRPGDTVLDPFLGSGTVAKVAKSLGRSYLGIELSRGYYEESVRRLGYQQLGELDTVLSWLLKNFLLGSRRRASREDCRFYFRQLLRARPTNIEARLSEWCRAFTGVDDVPKKEKPKLWAMGDEFLKSISSPRTGHLGLLSNIAAAYLNNYKLAKWFNGLRIGLIAHGLQQEIEPVLKSDRKMESVLDRIVEGEPSSYESKHKGNVVLLKQGERRVKAGVARRRIKEAPSATEPVLF